MTDDSPTTAIVPLIAVLHAAADRSLAERVAQALSARDFRCHLLEPKPTAEHPGEIANQHLGLTSGGMLVLLSQAANQTPHFSRAVAAASHANIKLLTVRLQDVAPAGALDLYLSPTHWFDLLDATDDNWESRLATACADFIDAKPAGPTSTAGNRSHKLLRHLKNNKAALAGLLLVVAAAAWLTISGDEDDREGIPPRTSDRAGTIAASDLKLISAAYASSGQIAYQFTYFPAPTAVAKLSGARISMSVDDGPFEQISDGSSNTDTFTRYFDSPPKKLSLLIHLPDGSQAGPFDYPTDELQRQADAAKSGLQQATQKTLTTAKDLITGMVDHSHLWVCESLAQDYEVPLICELATKDYPEFGQPIAAVSFGSSPEELPYLADIASPEKSRGVAMRGGYWMIPIPELELHYRATFSDGSKTSIALPDTSIRSRHDTIVVRVDAEPLDAPPILIVSRLRDLRKATGHDLMIAPLAGGNISTVSMQVDGGAIKPRKNSHGFAYFEFPGISKSPGHPAAPENPTIKYFSRDGGEIIASYKVPLQRIETETVIKATDFGKLVQCKKGGMGVFYASCWLEASPLILEKIVNLEVGNSPQTLAPSTFDIDSIIERWRQEKTEEIEQKTAKLSNPNSARLEYESKSKSLIREALAKKPTLERVLGLNPGATNGPRVIAATQDPQQDFYFRFTLKGNHQSEILHFSIDD